MLCKQNSPINFFIIEIDSGQVCLIRSVSLYVTWKGDVLLRVNLSKVDSRECILLVVADKNYGRCLPFVKIQTRFGSLAVTSKRGGSSRSRKNPSSCLGRIMSFRKTQNLCMSLVFGASRNFSLSDDKYILTFFTDGFENLSSSSFFNVGNLLSSIEQCTWLQLYFPFEKFYLDIHNKRVNNDGAAFPYETDFDISKDLFCWIDIFIRWFEDYQLPNMVIFFYFEKFLKF